VRVSGQDGAVAVELGCSLVREFVDRIAVNLDV